MEAQVDIIEIQQKRDHVMNPKCIDNYNNHNGCDREDQMEVLQMAEEDFSFLTETTNINGYIIFYSYSP